MGTKFLHWIHNVQEQRWIGDHTLNSHLTGPMRMFEGNTFALHYAAFEENKWQSYIYIANATPIPIFHHPFGMLSGEISKSMSSHNLAMIYELPNNNRPGNSAVHHIALKIIDSFNNNVHSIMLGSGAFPSVFENKIAYINSDYDLVLGHCNY